MSTRRTTLFGIVACAFLLCMSFAFAETTTSGMPIVTVTFPPSELVAVDDANVSATGTATLAPFELRSISNVPMNFNSAQVNRFLVAAARFIYNGDYTLRTRVADIAGNSASYTYTFTVNAPTQEIILLEPENGGTRTTVFNFTIQSEYPSQCRWEVPATGQSFPADAAGFGLMRPFITTTGSGGFEHTIIDFVATAQRQLVPNQPLPVTVMCLYDGIYSPREFSVTYLTINPSVTASSSPNPIIDPYNPVTTVTVQSNQEVWCEDIPQPDGESVATFGPGDYASYGTTITAQYTDALESGVAERELQLRCYNRAGIPATTNHTINLQYNEAVDIIFTSPSVVNRAPYNLTFTTNGKTANCTARGGTTPLALFPGTPTMSTSFRSNNTLTLSTRTTDFTATCTTPFTLSSPVSRTHTVRFDAEAPKLNAIIMGLNTCGLARIQFTLNATDGTNGSGIKTIEYGVTTANSSIIIPTRNVTADSELRVETPAIKLTNGTQVIITARVFDTAGNPSASVSKTVTATSSELPVCDTTPPTVRIVQQATKTGTNATLQCFDTPLQSGCKSTYQYTIKSVNSSGTCVVNDTQSATPLNTTVHVTQASFYCYKVKDNNGNTAEGRVRIYVNSTKTLPQNPVGTCSDGIKNRDETDVDCGGSFCGVQEKKLCAPQKKCGIGADCASSVCTAGVCEASSCTNARQDGTETDIDCGGTACVADGYVCAEGLRCNYNSDCESGTRCVSKICGPPISEEEPAPPDESIEGSSNILKLILIGLGSLFALGGIGYSILSSEPTRTRQQSTSQSMNEPIARFKTGGDEHGDELASVDPEQTARARAKRQQKRARQRDERQDAIKAFESADDVAALGHVTHKDVERAFKDLEPDEAKGAVRDLLENEKVSTKDVAVAIKDLETSGQLDDEAIDDLKKEFGIDKNA